MTLCIYPPHSQATMVMILLLLLDEIYVNLHLNRGQKNCHFESILSMTNEHSLALLYDYDINQDVNSFIEITNEYVHLVIICGVITLVLSELSDDPIMLLYSWWKQSSKVTTGKHNQPNRDFLGRAFSVLYWSREWRLSTDKNMS